jgi:two-component system LytT family sensor kinase
MAALSPSKLESRTIADRRRATWLLILAFWAFTYVVLSVRAEVAATSSSLTLLAVRRIWISLFGAFLCFGMSRLLHALRNRSFPQRIVWGVAGALVMAMLHTTFALSLNRVILPLPDALPITFNEGVQWVILWLGYFLAWTGTHLALTYHWEVQDQQSRITAMTQLTQEAQIAALRHQIGPHFLFNTLNSISSLVLERKNEEAERMLLTLSDFLRSTLALGASGTIDLAQEIELQRLYLAIEKERFAGRMTVEIEIPADLEKAQVPPLILQPLVENAIRHGVGRSEELTRIRIGAATSNGQLHLAVQDVGALREAPRPGTGLGLVNTRERLRVQFGDRAGLSTKDLSARGYRVEIDLPLELGE